MCYVFSLYVDCIYTEIIDFHLIHLHVYDVQKIMLNRTNRGRY